ncbi:hypothetical protein [Actinomadura vinacea]
MNADGGMLRRFGYSRTIDPDAAAGAPVTAGNARERAGHGAGTQVIS